MKRVMVGVFVVVLLLLAAGIYGHGARGALPVKSDSTGIHARSLRPLPDRIHALGRLEPRGTVIQLVPMSGNEGARVDRLLVAEGETVVAGQVMAVMDTHLRREAAVRESEANLLTAQQRLAQVLAGAKPGEIEAAEAARSAAAEQKEVAARKKQRAESLAKSRALSTEQIDEIVWEYDRANWELSRTTATLAAVREVRTTDVNVQQALVAAAEAQLSVAKANLAAAEVVAPISGKVLKIHTRPGERVDAQGILEMGDVEHMEVVAEVYEGDVGGLEPGLPAQMHVESAGLQLQGVVHEVGYLVGRKLVLVNDPVSDTDARVVEVRLQVAAADIPAVERLANARVMVSIELKRGSEPLAGVLAE